MTYSHAIRAIRGNFTVYLSSRSSYLNRDAKSPTKEKREFKGEG